MKDTMYAGIMSLAAGQMQTASLASIAREMWHNLFALISMSVTQPMENFLELNTVEKIQCALILLATLPAPVMLALQTLQLGKVVLTLMNVMQAQTTVMWIPPHVGTHPAALFALAKWALLEILLQAMAVQILMSVLIPA